MDLFSMAPLIISIVAIFLSITSFYYLHIQGPRFRVSLYSHTLKSYDVRKEIVFSLAIVNDGNKTGILKEIRLETAPQIETQQGYIMTSKVTSTSWGSPIEANLHINLPVAIKPKDSLIIQTEFYFFKVSEKRPLQNWPKNLVLKLLNIY